MSERTLEHPCDKLPVALRYDGWLYLMTSSVATLCLAKRTCGGSSSSRLGAELDLGAALEARSTAALLAWRLLAGCRSLRSGGGSNDAAVAAVLEDCCGALAGGEADVGTSESLSDVGVVVVVVVGFEVEGVAGGSRSASSRGRLRSAVDRSATSSWSSSLSSSSSE